jgi:hypothetical protein
MKVSTDNARKKNPQMPSAFELAVLANFAGGNLRAALHSYLAASEYLKKNGQAELALRHKKLSKKKIEAFGKLRDRGALSGNEGAIEYEKLVSGLKPALKLYKDRRDDQVKSAISEVTDRPCNYQTARDHLKRVWQPKPSRYTPSLWLEEVKAANNPWDRWCHKHTVVTQDNGKKRLGCGFPENS